MRVTSGHGWLNISVCTEDMIPVKCHLPLDLTGPSIFVSPQEGWVGALWWVLIIACGGNLSVPLSCGLLNSIRLMNYFLPSLLMENIMQAQGDSEIIREKEFGALSCLWGGAIPVKSSPHQSVTWERTSVCRCGSEIVVLCLRQTLLFSLSDRGDQKLFSKEVRFLKGQDDLQLGLLNRGLVPKYMSCKVFREPGILSWKCRQWFRIGLQFSILLVSSLAVENYLVVQLFIAYNKLSKA